MFQVIHARRRLVLGVASVAAAMTAMAWTLAVPGAGSATGTAAELTAASARIPKCAAADLGVWVAADQGQGAAGTIYTPLEFTNLSHHTCSLYGFPGVSAIGARGQQLGSSAVWDHTVKPRLVVLRPGATAHTMLAYSDVIVGNAPPASKRTAVGLRVYPPDQYRADHAFWYATVTVAKGLRFMSVRPITPGIGVLGSTG